jgi:5'-nucleotidase
MHPYYQQDLLLAKQLFALSPSAQQKTPISALHGVDILLGGHDHLYYVSKGSTSWESYDLNQYVLGAEEDHGDVLVVKSGTDFRDLSELTLELESTPNGVRKMVIKSITGVEHNLDCVNNCQWIDRQASCDKTWLKVL